jgi:hypothetical protein
LTPNAQVTHSYAARAWRHAVRGGSAGVSGLLPAAQLAG